MSGNQTWMKWKFRMLRYLNKFLDSKLVGSVFTDIAGIFLTFCTLGLFYAFTWRLVLVSLGVYTVGSWLVEQAHKWAMLRAQR